MRNDDFRRLCENLNGEIREEGKHEVEFGRTYCTFGRRGSEQSNLLVNIPKEGVQLVLDRGTTNARSYMFREEVD